MLIESLIKRKGGTVIELKRLKLNITLSLPKQIIVISLMLTFHHAKTLLRIKKKRFRTVDDVDPEDEDQGEA